MILSAGFFSSLHVGQAAISKERILSSCCKIVIFMSRPKITDCFIYRDHATHMGFKFSKSPKMAMNREYLYSFLNYKITVTSHCGLQEGYLVSVDPATLTIVLYDDIKESLSMILHHGVKSIQKCDQPKKCIEFKELCSNFFGKNEKAAKTFTTEELEERRERVLDLLRSNNVPVEDQDDLLIAAYSVSITPPYTDLDCQSTNAVVLNRIQNMIKQET